MFRMCARCIFAAALAACASAAHVTRISCLGDSITAGTCATQRTGGGYPAVLQRLLGRDFNVSGFALGGRTVGVHGRCHPTKPSNCSYWATQQYRDALASSPDVATVLLGYNDCKTYNWRGADSFVADYSRLIRRLKALPSRPRVYVVIPPPAYKSRFAIQVELINTLLPAVLPRLARDAGADGVIDVFAALGSGSAPDFTCDGVHPQDDAYERIARTIYEHLVGTRAAGAAAASGAPAGAQASSDATLQAEPTVLQHWADNPGVRFLASIVGLAAALVVAAALLRARVSCPWRHGRAPRQFVTKAGTGD